MTFWGYIIGFARLVQQFNITVNYIILSFSLDLHSSISPQQISETWSHMTLNFDGMVEMCT